MLAKHVLAKEPMRSYIANIAMKVNVKIGGVNSSVQITSPLMDPPIPGSSVAIMALDVHHPGDFLNAFLFFFFFFHPFFSMSF
jgi:hypothetical protein